MSGRHCVLCRGHQYLRLRNERHTGVCRHIRCRRAFRIHWRHSRLGRCRISHPEMQHGRQGDSFRTFGARCYMLRGRNSRPLHGKPLRFRGNRPGDILLRNKYCQDRRYRGLHHKHRKGREQLLHGNDNPRRQRLRRGSGRPVRQHRERPEFRYGVR